MLLLITYTFSPTLNPSFYLNTSNVTVNRPDNNKGDMFKSFKYI